MFTRSGRRPSNARAVARCTGFDSIAARRRRDPTDELWTEGSTPRKAGRESRLSRITCLSAGAERTSLALGRCFCRETLRQCRRRQSGGTDTQAICCQAGPTPHSLSNLTACARFHPQQLLAAGPGRVRPRSFKIVQAGAGPPARAVVQEVTNLDRPCVFPILSLKILGFTRPGEDRRSLVAGGSVGRPLQDGKKQPPRFDATFDVGALTISEPPG